MNQYKTLGTEWTTYIELTKKRPELFKQNDLMEIILDSEQVLKFQNETGTKIGIVYQSPYNMLVVDLVHSNGRFFAYERMLPTNLNAVVTVPIFNGKFVLLKQFRHSLRSEQYAFPRGYGEAGLSSMENAKKELMEELGVNVNEISELGTVVADSGLSGNKVSVYCCTIEAPKLKLYYEEILDVVELTDSELQTWIADGKITDGFTLAALSLYIAKNQV